jgi:alcohol dehydrogenase
MIKSGKLPLNKLIGRTVSLEEAIDELVNMDKFSGTGVTVINEF